MTVVPADTNNLEQSLSEDVETYIHRVGRTARAGRAGTAITFVGQYDIEMFDQLRRNSGRR